MGMLTSMLAPGNNSSVDNLTVSGVAVFKGAVTMDDTLTVSGAATFKTTVSIGGAAVLGDNLTVLGTTTLSGAAVAKTSLTVEGDTTLSGNVVAKANFNLEGNLTVSGAATFKGSVSFEGGVTYSGNATVKGNLLVEGTTTLSGAATMNSTLSVSGAAVMKSTLNVEGATTLSGNAVAKGTLLVEGASTLSGAATLKSTLNVEGSTTLSGNAVAKGTLLVEGATTLSGAATLKSTLNVEGAATISGAATFNTTVSVSGATVLKTTLNVEGATTLSGNAVAKGALLVEGAVTISGGATFNTTLNVEGATTLSGAATLKSTLNVEGAATISGAAVFKSTVTLSQDPAASLQAVTKQYVDAISQPNIIIGGNFSTNPWQRGTTFTSVANGTYTADRFSWIQSGSGVIDITQATDAPTISEAGILTSNSLKVAVTTADASIGAGDYYAIEYRIEGYDWSQIAQRSFTVSFWIRSTKTGIFNVGFRNSGGDQSYVHEYTVDASNTWEYKSFTVSASPSAGTWLYTNGLGLIINFPLACGSTFGSGTNDAWTANNMFATTNQVNAMDSNTNIFELALFKIEAGSVATPYSVENEQQILAKCQRYYYQATANSTPLGVGLCNSTSQIVVQAPIPVTMRDTPNSSGVSNAGHYTIYYGAGATSVCTALSVNLGSKYGDWWLGTATGTPLTAGDVGMIYATNASAYFYVGAEL